MNTKLSKKVKNDFGKDFFKLINNSNFGTCMENERRNRDIKLVTTKGFRNYFLLEPNYQTTKSFSENLSAKEWKKAVINKPLYLGLSAL